MRVQLTQLYSMSLFSSKPHSWHPANASLKAAVVEASRHCEIANVALGFGLTSCGEGPAWTPTVVGFATPEEVDTALEVYRGLGQSGLARRAIGEGLKDERRALNEKAVAEEIEGSGCRNWSWLSPPASEAKREFVVTHQVPHRS